MIITAKYGLPYQGSKSAIAEKIINFLPAGKRFVDLFGGGAAMSDYAVKSGKYETVFYNEINPLLCDLVKKAIAGFYNYSVFKPEFISREQFHSLKSIDGYVKYIWSFGNDGRSYLFSPELEPQKCSLHNFVVFSVKDDFIKSNFDDIEKFVAATDIHTRRRQLRRYMRIQMAVRPHQELEQLERLQQLEINNGSYLDYQYQDGDVVYCDPPYENTGGYGTVFDHKQFYDWAATRPYQVFFSSYQITDNRFKIIWQTPKQNLFNSGSGQFTVTEFLYTNKTIKPNRNDPLSLFQSVLYG